jgi:CheY-like chemotaxis protein
MSTILIVDDRATERQTIVDLVRYSLPEGSTWTARGIEPLGTIDEYRTFITEEDVSVIVLDEKLQEQVSEKTGEAVTYNGHELVNFLRPRFPDLPIFVVTAYNKEDDLQSAASDVESILSRNEFNKRPEIHTARMIRSGHRFAEALQSDLNVVSDISHKLAVGNATDEEIKKLTSIREKLALPFPTSDLTHAKDLVPHAEKLISEAQALLAKIRAGRE